MTQPDFVDQTEMIYTIKVKGQLDKGWSEWFDGLTISPDDKGYTTLSGPVTDQAALYGLLIKIRDLGLPLLSVNCVKSGSIEAVV